MATKIANVKGAQGAAGTAGATGDPGSKGPQGNPGGVGAQGPSGPRAVSADANNGASLGSDSLIYVPAGATQPLASPSSAGLLQKVSGLVTDFVDGSNNCQDLAAAIKPTIYLVRNRAYNALQNSAFEVDQYRVGNKALSGTSNAVIVDRWIAYSVTAGAGAWIIRSMPGNPMAMPGTTSPVTQAPIEFNLTAQQTGSGSLSLSQWVEGIKARPLMGVPHSVSLVAWSDAPTPFNFSISIRNPTPNYSYTKLLTHPGGYQTVYFTVPNIPAMPTANFPNFGIRGSTCYTLGVTLMAQTFLIAPTDGIWSSVNYIASPGQTQFSAFPTGTRFWLCAIQHEPGALCSNPIPASFDDQLIQCQRYYQKSNSHQNAFPTSGDWMRIGSYVPTTTVRAGVHFPTQMAASPAVVITNHTGALNQIYIDNINATTPVSSVTCDASGFNNIVITAQAAATYCPPAFGQWSATVTAFSLQI